MTNQPPTSEPPFFLGIEGGGTRTVAIFANARSQLVGRVETGPANLRLLDDSQLLRRFREIARHFPRPIALGICLAGARDEKDRRRITDAAAKVWPGVTCHATHDLDSAWAAAEMQGRGQPMTRVVVLSGTGSCCYGRTPDGRTAKLGGWGHLIGDKGSGFEIGLRALKAVAYYLDRDGTWSRLGQQILRTLQLNEPEELIPWVQTASKDDIASLALEVFSASSRGDPIAKDILAGAASQLAKDAVSCAKRLTKPGTPMEFVFAGSVLLKQPRFARQVARNIRKVWPNARCVTLRIESAWGAVVLAKRSSKFQVPSSKFSVRPSRGAVRTTGLSAMESAPPKTETLSPTEARNPRSMNLHKLSLAAGIRLMLSEEANVSKAVLAERKPIERALRMIVRALRRGGRLFYVGAGTSGRLGVLDASECPPTFRTPPEMVQGIIAGGQRALWQAVEGAEDDAGAGARSIQFREVSAPDVVVGIAASGRTPFVWGALTEAKRRRASTILICFNPSLNIARRQKRNVVIAPKVGPEILTGSTRLKCGTATKLILNLFTTLAMVRLGKVVSNLMVDLNPSNTKLRDRAVRIVCELAGCDSATAQTALERSRWIVKDAWRALRKKSGRQIRSTQQSGLQGS